MKAIVTSIVVCTLCLGFAQERTVPGHTTKNGTWAPAHKVKPRKSKEQVAADMISQGRHREHRNYPGHYDKDGHWVKPHSAWVWVKD